MQGQQQDDLKAGKSGEMAITQPNIVPLGLFFYLLAQINTSYVQSDTALKN